MARSATAAATLALQGTEGSGEKTWTISTSSLQDWLDGVASNYGWVLKSDTEADDGHHFRPSEYITAAERPELVIEYTEGGGGGLAIPVAMATYRRRRAV